jgi:TolB-like protein/Flp pilus assembly protein TadD
MPIYKFRDCCLNVAERRVLKNNKYLELTPKTFDVLQLLVEKCSEIVTKDEILERVWNGSFVEEGNLPVHISKLRRLLDETKNEPFIETIQGSGYRFIAPVQTVNEDEWTKHLPDRTYSSPAKTEKRFAFDSIAVLPLENESNNPEIDYLADGLTESLINSLSHVSNLKVIARNTVFRYKNKPADAKEVGETLGVAAVLTGRIKLIKDHLLISVELTKVADDTQLWGTRFNQPFANIIKIQEEITFAVTEKLRAEITHAAGKSSNNPISQDSESYRLYLKGKYFLDKRTEDDIYKAIEYFQKSISYDPTNVFSYVETVECYLLLYIFDYISYTDTLAKIKPLLTVISKLNQSIDVVQTMYGGIKIYLEWKFEESKEYLQYALTLNPNCLIARLRYSHLLMVMGRFSEALNELYKLMVIDPLSLVNYKCIGRLFYKMGRFENAVTYLKEALELEANDFEALALLGGAMAELGNYNEALALFQKSLNIHYNVDTLSMFGYVYALSGKKEMTSQIIKQLESESKSNYPHAIKLARIYAALEERETAYRYLEQAFAQHEVDLNSLKSDPRWTTICPESRFKELVKRVGLSVD